MIVKAGWEAADARSAEEEATIPTGLAIRLRNGALIMVACATLIAAVTVRHPFGVVPAGDAVVSTTVAAPVASGTPVTGAGGAPAAGSGSTTEPAATAPSETGAPDAGAAVMSAPPTTSAPTPVASSSAPPVITSADGQLWLGGQPYRFVGMNAYEIATDWGVNGSCGQMTSGAQLDQLFASLPPDSLVRFWAWQGSAAVDIATHQVDWAPLDRVFAAAAEHHQRLVVSLAGQSGACDGGDWKGPSWYRDGFMEADDRTGLTPLSYWDYVQAVVSRYRSSPALGLWEPISEPEASTCPIRYQPSDCGGHQICPDEVTAQAALRHFFDAVGSEIHALDPDHLVESGTIGSGQCGTSGADFAAVSSSPGIDVLSYHDYNGPVPLGGDQWNGLGLRLQQAAAMGKPLIVGEVGLSAGAGQACVTPGERARQFRAKEQGQLGAGVSGLLAWNWESSPPAGCSLDTYPGDPLMSVIAAGVRG